MRTARFKIHGRFDGASGATVTIERDSLLVTVRPTRRRKVATYHLADVATMLLWRRAKAEAAERKAARKRKAAR